MFHITVWTMTIYANAEVDQRRMLPTHSIAIGTCRKRTGRRLINAAPLHVSYSSESNVNPKTPFSSQISLIDHECDGYSLSKQQLNYFEIIRKIEQIRKTLKLVRNVSGTMYPAHGSTPAGCQRTSTGT